ncbi:hypothetical protein TNCV_3790701 [Trichonephila clavipes]|nr:hypothetical protein TNCV_3790701 [Trichonephila clavipes]
MGDSTDLRYIIPSTMPVYKATRLESTTHGLLVRDNHNQFIDNLSANFEFHFQWIPSHIGIIRNEIADSLVRAASLNTPRLDMHFTFSEVFSDKKKQGDLWRVPPEHVWYPRKHPGGALFFEDHKAQKNCASQFASGT